MDTEPLSEQKCLLDECPTTPAPSTSEQVTSSMATSTMTHLPTSTLQQLLKTTVNDTDNVQKETGISLISNNTEQPNSTMQPDNTEFQKFPVSSMKNDVDVSDDDVLRETTSETTEVKTEQVGISTESLREGGATDSQVSNADSANVNLSIGSDGISVGGDLKANKVELGSSDIFINENNMLVPQTPEQDPANVVEGSNHRHRHHHQHRNHRHRPGSTEIPTPTHHVSSTIESVTTVGPVADIPDISSIKEGGSDFYEDDVQGGSDVFEDYDENNNVDDIMLQKLHNSQSLDYLPQEVTTQHLEWKSSDWNDVSIETCRISEF